MKRILIALAVIAGSLAPAYGSGTIPFSLSQQFDQFGKPLAGCSLSLIRAGTTSTPQNGYQDAALTVALPNPIRCDAAGRLPQFFLADGQIKVRLTDKNGVVQLQADGIQVIGPSGGGGGGGGTVDATTVLSTGDIKVRYSTGTLSGFVRANGRTIGSATSGATERANADTQALFLFLWNTDSTLTVSGGRGASASADWTANKTIKLPDMRGTALAGLDDMGNTVRGTYTDAQFGLGDATTLGSQLGRSTRAIAQANLPAVSPTFTGLADSVSVKSTTSNVVTASSVSDVGINNGTFTYSLLSGGTRSELPSEGTFTPSGTISALGSGTPFQINSPYILLTIYMKL